MVIGFLDLPAEIRLSIYQEAFRSQRILLLPSSPNEATSLLPAAVTIANDAQRSSQLLRVCRTVLFEARPILYANSTFHVTSETFAARLPAYVTDGNPIAEQMRHLVWQVECDMLKKFYPEDLRLDATIIRRLSTLELRCRAEGWKGSFLGEWCDLEDFVKGREQILAYATALRDMMESKESGKVSLIEDRNQLSKGRVVVRLARNTRCLKQEEILVS